MYSRWSSAAVFAALLLLAPGSLAAQAEFGIKGGISYGNISNKGVLPGNLDNRTGFAAGASVGFRARVIGIGAEALFAQRGVTSDVVAAAERKLDYLDIPVYLKVQLPTPGISPFAYAGPQVSIELRCKDQDDDCVDVNADGRAKTDYAGVIGAGVKIGSEKGFGFTVEARYIYGLRDLKIETITSTESYKTRSFLVLAGVLF